MRNKIIILDGYTANPGDVSWKVFKNLGEITIYERTPASLVIERVKEADILVTNKVKITKDLMDKLPNLKLIVVMATGFNIVDVKSARDLGIPVCNVQNYSTKSVSQLVFAYILHFQNKIIHYNCRVQKGAWSKSKDFTFHDGETNELADKTIGIVGFGQIGRNVATIANAFGMRILATSRNPNRDAVSNVEITDIDTVLSKSDFLTLHIPLNDETFEFINEKTLSQMKSSAILINTGRGPLVNESDLVAALKGKKIGGAALDVLVEEPPKENHPLLGFDNCIITPHIAWSTQEARARLLKGVADNILAFQAGNPINVVN